MTRNEQVAFFPPLPLLPPPASPPSLPSLPLLLPSPYCHLPCVRMGAADGEERSEDHQQQTAAAHALSVRTVIEVTLEVSKLSRRWLKLLAPRNID